MARKPAYEKDVSPDWPDVDADTLRAMGRFVVAWAVLEGQINETIADIYDFDSHAAMAVTANLGTKAKLELFMAGVAIYEDWLKPQLDLRDINKLATDTASASNKYRNMLAHGTPLPFQIADNEDEMFEHVILAVPTAGAVRYECLCGGISSCIWKAPGR